MRLFLRTVPMSGPVSAILEQNLGMREFVSQKIGREVALWTAQFGAPVGTVTFTLRVEGLADLAQITETLMADPGYHERLGSGAEFVNGPVEDTLLTPLNGEAGDPPPVGTVVMATRAVIAGGKYADGVAWGIDMAAHSEQVTGYPVGFYMSEFGTFGEVAWLSGAPDAASVDAAGQKMNADPGYLERLGSVGDLFVPASGLRMMATRIA